MTTSYPYGIDVFTNPTITNHLNDIAVPHHSQHTNINDAMFAVQNWIGVSSSFPLTGGATQSIEYRIHNIVSGHDHDGFNSKPSALGPPLFISTQVSGVYSYVSGFFPFSSSTPTGNAVDQINRYLQDVSASLNSVTASFNARQLLLLSEAPGGPYEGFEPGAYSETGYLKVFVTQSTWYTDSTKVKKIIESFVNYNSNKTINSITQSVYAIDGITILKTSIDSIYYSGIFESYRSRSIF